MDALLSEEQEALRQMTAALAADLGTRQSRDLADEPDPRGWAALTRAGLVGLHAPEEVGGAGASGVDVAIVAEQLGRTLTRQPYVGGVLAVELARLAGADELVGDLADGSRRMTVALTSRLDALGEAGTPGALAWDAAGCDQVLLLAGSDVVVADIAPDPVEGIDVTRVVQRVAPGAATTRVGTLDEGAAARWLTFALTCVTADLVGVMDGALALAVRYAKERTQFGSPIGAFQAIAHLCADQAVRVSAARSALNYAAWSIDEEPAATALSAARTAKAYASEAARPVTEAVIQVHGGIGITWECMAHLFLRRALMARLLFGDEEHQLARLGDERRVA